MSELHTRKEKRTPVTLKIKFKSATLDQFIERYSVDVSHGGIFIRTKDPLAVGTQLRFEFQLQDASPLISGDGTVVWTREFDPSRVGVAPGMGVRFDRLAPESQPILEQILSRKAGGPSSRELDRFEGAGGSGPGMQGEKTRITPPTLASSLAASSRLPSQPAVPTPAAPLVRGGLAGLVPPRGGFTDEPSKDATPLPKPMPFNVGGEDEFSEDVFEQPTKVASLDVLLKHEEEHARQMQAEALAAAAAAARQAQQLRGDLDDDEQTEVVAKPAGERHRSRPDIRVVPPIATAQIVEDPAPRPGTPRPAVISRPAVARPVTTPPAKVESFDEPTPSAPPPSKPTSGPAPSIHEPRFLEGGRPHVHVPSELVHTTPSRARPSPTTDRTTARRSSPVGIILGAIVLVAAAAAVWYFVIRPGSEGDEPSAPRFRPTDRTAQEPPTGPRDPLAAPAAAPAPTPAPAAKKGKLLISATPSTATLAIDGAAPGAVSTELELESGRHQLAFSAPCHRDETVSVDVTADVVKEVNAKLKPLDRVVRVSTEPPGAQLIVDGKPAGKTPTDVRLVGRLDPRAEHSFVFRKPGFDEAQTIVPPDAACRTDGDVAVVGLQMTLTKPRPAPPPRPTRPAPRPAPRPTPAAAPRPIAAPPPVVAPKPVPATPEPPKAEPVTDEALAEPPKPMEDPKPEPPTPAAEPAPAPKPEQKDCDPSPDAPEWAKCK